MQKYAVKDRRSEKRQRKEGREKDIMSRKRLQRKKGKKEDRDKEGQTEREMIRFLSPLYGSGQEPLFQSNQAQAKVNNQS